MVTRDTPYPTTDTFLDVVVNKDISITISGSGMVSIHSGESQWISTSGSNISAHSITMNGNVSVAG